jgi:hypothetical protein
MWHFVKPNVLLELMEVMHFLVCLLQIFECQFH